MKRMIIVGAGGLGREVCNLASADVANGVDWHLAGYLDTREHALDGVDSDLPILGDPTSYVPGANDMFIVAVGDPRIKRRLVAPLRLKGGVFVSLRTNVLMSVSTRYGATVFGDRARISVDCSIGDYAFIGDDAIVGHDVKIGDYAHVGTRCFLAGKVCIEDDAVVHPMSSIAIGVRVGRGATVGLGSVVFHNVPDGTTVVGNPARMLPRSDHSE